MCDDLLEEGDKLNCVVLVWFRQVDVFQVDHETACVFWFEDATLRECTLHADLVEFLDYLCGCRLGVAVYRRYLDLLDLSKLVECSTNEQTLSTTFRTAYDEWLAVCYPWLQYLQVALEAYQQGRVKHARL